MPTPILADAFAHHIWATIRLLDLCADLDDAQLASTVPGTYGSILDTLRHLVDGDVFYLDVLRGGEPESFDKEASIPTLRSVMESLTIRSGRTWSPAISTPRPTSIEYEDGGYETHSPLGIRLAQALYHGTDHRSQVCTALTALGIEPPAIEAWTSPARTAGCTRSNRLERRSLDLR